MLGLRIQEIHKATGFNQEPSDESEIILEWKDISQATMTMYQVKDLISGCVRHKSSLRIETIFNGIVQSKIIELTTKECRALVKKLIPKSEIKGWLAPID